MIKHSIVLTPLIPTAETSMTDFRYGAEEFARRGVSVVEYYTPERQISSYQQVLSSLKQTGIYLHAVRQKREGWNLSSLDEEERKASVKTAITAVKTAGQGGAAAVLITSGKRPGRTEDLKKAVEALEQSLVELLDRCEIPLLLEPGDCDVHMCQTVGATSMAIDLLKRINSPLLSLTMDTSHLAQLGEDIINALTLARSWCGHVHLANCVLKTGHPLFGDKHPFFSEPDSVFTSESLKAIAEKLPAIFENKPCVVSLEVISQGQSREESIRGLCSDAPWFFA